MINIYLLLILISGLLMSIHRIIMVTQRLGMVTQLMENILWIFLMVASSAWSTLLLEMLDMLLKLPMKESLNILHLSLLDMDNDLISRIVDSGVLYLFKNANKHLKFKSHLMLSVSQVHLKGKNFLMMFENVSSLILVGTCSWYILFWQLLM